MLLFLRRFVGGVLRGLWCGREGEREKETGEVGGDGR